MRVLRCSCKNRVSTSELFLHNWSKQTNKLYIIWIPTPSLLSGAMGGYDTIYLLICVFQNEL